MIRVPDLSALLGVLCLVYTCMVSQNLDAANPTQLHQQLLALINDHRHQHGALPPRTALQERRHLNKHAKAWAQYATTRISLSSSSSSGLLWVPGLETSTCVAPRTRPISRNNVQKPSGSAGILPATESIVPSKSGANKRNHSLGHCEKNVLFVAKLDAPSLFRALMKRGSFRRRLEWIGFNESGLGIARLPNRLWIVVHILASDTHRLYSDLRTPAYLHVRVGPTWRVARFLRGQVVSSLRPQPCERILWRQLCYASSSLRIFAEDLCNGKIYRLSVEQQNHTFHRFVGQFPRFRAEERIEFRKGKGWVDGKVIYVAHRVDTIHVLYGVLHKHTYENVCAWDIRKPQPKQTRKD